MKKIITLITLMLFVMIAKSQTIISGYKNQVTVETRDTGIVKLINSPRVAKTSKGLYRISIKAEERKEVENKILWYLNKNKK